MSEEHKIGLAYIIFQNSGKFKSDLKEWNNKPVTEKNWANMKTHFREALDNIRATDDNPIKESTYDQMNMVNGVLDGAKTQNKSMIRSRKFCQTYIPTIHIRNHQANTHK